MKKVHKISNFECQTCPKSFSTLHQLHHHVCKYQCITCREKFDSKQSLDEHLLHCNKPFVGPLVKRDSKWKCPICPVTFKQVKYVYRHVRSVHKRPFELQCKDCQKTFTTQHNFDNHECIDLICHFCHTTHNTRKSFNKHLQKCIPNQQHPPPTAPFTTEPFYPADDVITSIDTETEVQSLYRDHWPSLRTHAREGPRHRSYTFRWTTQTNPDWGDWLRKVFLRQNGRFKLNVAHSSILYNSELDGYKFFHASFNNETIWSHPRLIKNWEDMEAVAEELHNYDVLEQVFRQRHDTKSIVRKLCSTSIYVTVLPSHPLGGCCLEEFLPTHLSRNRNIVHFLHNHQQHPIKDNLCFFRCLAYHRHPTKAAYHSIINQISTDA